MNNRGMGIEGEQLATEYLKSKGYSIVKRNYTCPFGEIDIIAQINDTLVFVEVKSRTSDKYGMPVEAVTKKKVDTIRRCALNYYSQDKQNYQEYRFDVIEVYNDNINHIENAFF